MVERLKVAIEKARERRAGAEADGAASAASQAPTMDGAVRASDALWDTLPQFAPDERRMQRERIITYGKTHAAHAAFDVLRTRLIKVCRDKGWSRVGITSPMKGCGKSVVSANLAFSLARRQDARGLLIDVDLRAPRINQIIGFREQRRIAQILSGEVSIEQAFVRTGRNLAIAFNTVRERDPSEIMQSKRTAENLASMIRALTPDLVIYDLPPLLVVDDAIGFLPNLDGVLLVIAAGQTRPQHVTDCERLIGDATNFLGVVLNKQDEEINNNYVYEYASS